MKKYAALMGLAVFALPACTNQNGYSHHYDQGQNSQYQESQYPAQDNRDNYADNGMNSGDHKEWKDAKLNAMVDHFFEKADTNHDGYISWKEFETFMRKHFREADKNHDGMLSRDEVMAMKRHEMREVHEEMHGDRSGMRSDKMHSDDNEAMNSDDSTARGTN